MSLGESSGGLPPDSVVEPEGRILEDSQRAVDEFHDPDRGALRRVVLAPCSPFSVTPELMAESASLAREMGVALHTHLAETVDEEQFCLDRFERRPVEYVEDLGWAGPDVWYAHAVHISHAEVERMAASGTGVSHCPTSNMRLASGLAPVSRYLEAGVRVGLGVDGSASNDSSHLLAEARQALLLNRLAVAPGLGAGAQMPARRALEMATTGGAAVLGRDDIGRLAPGYAADLVTSDVDENDRPFITGEVNLDSLAWRPDGKAISFLARRGKDTLRTLYAISIDGGGGVNLQQLGDFAVFSLFVVPHQKDFPVGFGQRILAPLMARFAELKPTAFYYNIGRGTTNPPLASSTISASKTSSSSQRMRNGRSARSGCPA